MRGTKAKKLRRQVYGQGMPRNHDYMDINGPFRRQAGNIQTGYKTVITQGTFLTQSARRMYQLLKRGQEVQGARV